MSDEAHIQAAFRHADSSVILPWCGQSPDEEVMEREDLESAGEPVRRAWMLEVLMAFLFADKHPEVWENVGLRALAIYRHCLPAELARRDTKEEDALKRYAQLSRGFRLAELVELSKDEDWREMMAGIMGYMFPPRKRWLYKGTQRAYLLARAYQPGLVTIRKQVVAPDHEEKVKETDMSYEDMARIFERDPLTTERAQNRARSRWSARAQQLIRLPIEQAGGVARMPFGKSASAREAMAASAKGNRNRGGGVN